MEFKKFVDEMPSDQAALDIFKGHWASRLPDWPRPLVAGDTPHFDQDPRPLFAAQAFGDCFGRLDGQTILELGPMEGGHSYQLERLGGTVIGIEGNTEAYLKCLITRQILDLRARFYLGNFMKYLAACHRQFDIVFAAGVLYHMTKPVDLIRAICERTDKCFMWTHYYPDTGRDNHRRVDDDYSGLGLPHFQHDYGDRAAGQFWGGLADTASWLERDSILTAFRSFGHMDIQIVEEDVNHPHGPCFSIATRRPAAMR